MNNRQYLLLVIFSLLVSNSASAQKLETTISLLSSIPNPENFIVYNPAQKLAVGDFKGNPDAGSSAVATTTSGFMFKAAFRSAEGKATLAISVYCSFDKNLSWMKERGKTAYVLSHEQHHFDISYIGMSAFVKKIQRITFRQDNYLEKLKEAYNAEVGKMERLQNQYDSETRNGTLADKQVAWNDKINALLNSLQTVSN